MKLDLLSPSLDEVETGKVQNSLSKNWIYWAIKSVKRGDIVWSQLK
jgi:hypothetical protein